MPSLGSLGLSRERRGSGTGGRVSKGLEGVVLGAACIANACPDPKRVMISPDLAVVNLQSKLLILLLTKFDEDGANWPVFRVPKAAHQKIRFHRENACSDERKQDCRCSGCSLQKGICLLAL